MSYKYRRRDGKPVVRKNRILGGRGVVDPDNPEKTVMQQKTRWRSLNQYVTDKVAEGKKLGLSDVNTAAFAGISLDSLRLWKRLGKEEAEMRVDPDYTPDHDLTPLVNFYKTYVQAKMNLDVKALAVVGNAITEGNVDMAWKWLQARYPEEYAPAKRMEISGRDGGAIEVAPVIQQIPASRLEMLKIPAGATGTSEDE